MRLNIDSDQDAKLAKLLEKTSLRMHSTPDMLRHLPDGTIQLSCPLPEKYKPEMNPWAKELRARIDAGWRIFEISECSQSVSGGWMASCIPPPLFRIFFTAWLNQPEPLPLGQLELFPA
ncbi:hypothetical protein [Comamonas sp. AG1104]|uniref:hypothetical protein n=1 Tax=Comamonas sp. AG1104 TaxID=2183900 RepID=UPI000E2B6E50|nr:hypothetical protein [Comamonas sp. AG1104]RDI11028.1 hypothetical protein DFO48_105544 [Comamonas sp. AG1104]